MYKNPKKLRASKGTSTMQDDDANTTTMAIAIPGVKGTSVMQPAASALEGVKLVKGEVVGMVGFRGGGGGGGEKLASWRPRRGGDLEGALALRAMKVSTPTAGDNDLMDDSDSEDDDDEVPDFGDDIMSRKGQRYEYSPPPHCNDLRRPTHDDADPTQETAPMQD
ncbi:hypothetical protein NLJ89_g8787 [Agrocybe chaxingu]|uniref:Uncharacterized protein n=1 Tax=Agrocybe chaxingu TaxID=84603 RepID=A0A9W8K169_9AGAR|nr:hypothetical protein NLJ89_g8787 [Agrocybe chaxingu]